MTGLIDSEIGRTMGRLSHAKTEKELAALRERLADLNRKRAQFIANAGTAQDQREFEDSIASISGMRKGYSP